MVALVSLIRDKSFLRRRLKTHINPNSSIDFPALIYVNEEAAGQ